MRRIPWRATLCLLLSVSCAGSEGDLISRYAGDGGVSAALDAEVNVDASAMADARADVGGTSQRREVDFITFNWPSRFGTEPGVDSKDEQLFVRLRGRASAMSLQEAGWIAGYIRSQGWHVYRPNPPGDGDDQPVGNLVAWDPAIWQQLDEGWHLLSPETRIQPEAAGPALHRTKYLIWVRLKRVQDGSEWFFASVHFVPSKHLGGETLALWKRQRDSLLTWWKEQPDRSVVGGDFNAQPTDRVAQPIWDVAKRQTVASLGERKIDWVVRKPALRGVSVEALSNLGQSDHRPVLARLLAD